MKIERVILTRVRIPFRRAFSHAAASRSESDAIFVAIQADSGLTGFGEIQARPYVTGESNDAIWSAAAAREAARLIGKSVDRPVSELMGGAGRYCEEPALIGGFDLALHDLLALAGVFDWSRDFGTLRSRPAQRCLTIGGDYRDAELRKQAMIARMGRYSVVKLKVASPDDAERVIALRKSLGDACRIRLDANGEMSLASALELLASVAEAGIESIEEPLPPASDNLIEQLVELHSTSGVAIVADESICTTADVAAFAGRGAYQIANVRIGKCGGVEGTRRVIAACRQHGFAMVCGTMVGESAVMLSASERLLEHCDDLDYVEGLDQAEKLLVEQVILPSEPASQRFQWDSDALERYRIGEQEFC